MAPDSLQVRAHLCPQCLHVLCTHETTLLPFLDLDFLLRLGELVAVSSQPLLRQVQEAAGDLVPDPLEGFRLVRLWWFSDVS